MSHRPEKQATKYSLIWAARVAPAQRKLVLMALANYSNADGSHIFPAVATVADICCLGINATRCHIHELTKKNLITIVKQATQHWPTVYALNLQAIAALPKCAARSKPSSPVVVNTESTSSPDLVIQHSNFSVPDLHKKGADPNDPDVSQGRTPSGSTASPPPLGAGYQVLPKRVDHVLFDLLVKNGKQTKSRIDALVNKAHELVQGGHDVNGLMQQAVERGWAAFPLPPKPKPPTKRARSAKGLTSAKTTALRLGEGTDWGMPK